MSDQLRQFESWLETLPNTQKSRVAEFLDVLRESHQQELVIGLYVNVTPNNEITFDTNKVSYGSIKKLLLDPV